GPTSPGLQIQKEHDPRRGLSGSGQGRFISQICEGSQVPASRPRDATALVLHLTQLAMPNRGSIWRLSLSLIGAEYSQRVYVPSGCFRARCKMKIRSLSIVNVTILLASVVGSLRYAVAQEPATQPQAAAPATEAAYILAEFTQSLNGKKLKPGDRV